ncbi:MAG: hypothetical protein AB9M53_07375 [Leptothrix sp. (in: b-proteobacteria)]
MAAHSKRITAAVTPEIALTYETLASATGRTVSSVVNDVLASRALEVNHFVHWFNQQPDNSSAFAHGLTAVDHIGSKSLIDAIREIEPGYRTPEELQDERADQGKAVLQVLDEAVTRGIAIDDQLAATLLQTKNEVGELHEELRAARKREREALSLGFGASTNSVHR